MRIPRCRTALVLAFVCLPLSSRAQETPATIQVTGHAEIRVVPDEVVVTFGIETLGKVLQESKADNDKRFAALAAVAKKMGIADEHIKADYLEIRPLWRDEYRPTELIGYRARRTVIVTLRSLGRLEPLIERALEAGTNYVHGIEFRTTELRKHRDAARAAALDAALDKARAMAARLGQELGEPHEIQEGYGSLVSPHGWWGPRREGLAQVSMQDAGAGADSAATLRPGQIAVTANVNVTFRLQ